MKLTEQEELEWQGRICDMASRVAMGVMDKLPMDKDDLSPEEWLDSVAVISVSLATAIVNRAYCAKITVGPVEGDDE